MGRRALSGATYVWLGSVGLRDTKRERATWEGDKWERAQWDKAEWGHGSVEEG